MEFKRIWLRIRGRDIRSISKRVNGIRNDIDSNIKANDESIARLAEAITILKTAQDNLQAENATGVALRDSISVIG